MKGIGSCMKTLNSEFLRSNKDFEDIEGYAGTHMVQYQFFRRYKMKFYMICGCDEFNAIHGGIHG